MLLVLLLYSLVLSACQRGPSLGPGTEELLASAAEVDCGFVQTAYGQRVSWKKNIPVVLKIHPDYPVQYEEVLRQAGNKWSEAAGMTLFLFERQEALGENKSQRNGVNTIHWITDWPEAQKSLQALTHLYWKGNQLSESDIVINSKYFQYFTTEPQDNSGVHLESLLIHELGHVLGLKHRTSMPSVMWTVLNGGIKRETLTSADRESLKCEY